ncbi:MAG: cytochrome c family protein [Sandaracinaceae bacterium]
MSEIGASVARHRLARALAVWMLVGCDGAAHETARPVETVEEAAFEPSVERGRELLVRFECNRCHEGTGTGEPSLDRDCVGCHRAIQGGTFDAPAADLRRFRRALVSLNEAPSLAHLGGRLDRGWIEQFLLAPHDVRPGLLATMPRLRIDEHDAADLAAALTDGADAAGIEPVVDADPGAGLALLDARGCADCHAFGSARPARGHGDIASERLAPDLAHTRVRMTRAMIEAWLTDPQAVRPGTLMPTPRLTPDERAAIIDAILAAPIARPDIPREERLPVLERPVRFAEIQERILTRTCWHCHADPDFARGDGGPGNTGGFGFSPRGVNLLDYEGISSGYFDEAGERRSLFAPDEDGTPHLIRVLSARREEEAGRASELRGMPLGLPALSREDIQLVETWIAQGRPN